jgi:nucleoid-associated protein YgaU
VYSLRASHHREYDMPNAKGPTPDFSDVKSGSSSASSGESPPTNGHEQTYTVKSGDSLSKIAQRHYGDGRKWRAIFEANRNLITNPDLIHPGQVLTLPPAGDITP